MSPHRYKLFTSNPELVQEAIWFFFAEISDAERFAEIKSVASAKAKLFNKPNAETFISMGYFSVFDFLMYITEKRQIKDGVQATVIENLADALAEEKLLNTLPQSLGNSNEKRYRPSESYAKFFYDKDLILNILCGWKYIVEKYKNSVLKIEHEDLNGDFHIGTGFYFAVGDETVTKYIIITNKHVLENAKKIKIFTNDDQEIILANTFLDSKRDLGYIELESALITATFHFNCSIEVMSDILTIGYPSIPMTRQAYQVYHRGELNSFVEDYSGNKLFLFSAKTSSGNSGSPIIDRNGMVLGIVTEELFEKELFYEKGKLPYYAGIPSEEIINSLNEIFFNKSI